MNDPKVMCWDSCVFIRYITATPAEFVSDIEDYIREAQKKRRTIFYSTIVRAEIRLSFLRARGYETIDDFFRDFEGAFEPVNPDPNILSAAAILHDAIPTDPGTGGPTKRRIGTPDAIHLATCLYVRNALGYRDAVFHTFDKGKSRSWEDRCVPLIGFERWFPNPSSGSLVAEVCNLSRLEPAYPQLRLAVSNR